MISMRKDDFHLTSALRWRSGTPASEALDNTQTGRDTEGCENKCHFPARSLLVAVDYTNVVHGRGFKK
jgi:hypothetical protein